MSGAPEAPRGTAADGKTELFNVPGYPLMVRAADFNRLHADNERLAALVAAQQPAPSAAAAEHYDEVRATLTGLHALCENISAMERRVGPLGSHARGYTHKITAALRHLDALASSPTPQADSAPGDADGEAFRTAARLGLTLRFYGGCAQSSIPGTPSAHEVVAGHDRATAMREAVERAAEVIAKGGEPQRLDSLAPQADSQPAPDEIVSVAREQGLPETEIEGVFRVNADDLCRVVAADRAARAPADSVLEDAARWQETLMHVGAANHLGGQHFTLNTLRIRDQMFLLRGSVAQHFTACIDDSRAARKQGGE